MEAGILLILLAIVIYFLPTICAYSRGHQNKDPVFILNLFLGWTLLGWVVSLAWAFTAVQSSDDDDDEEESDGDDNTKTKVEQLSELNALYQSGAINDDEFAMMKSEIIQS